MPGPRLAPSPTSSIAPQKTSSTDSSIIKVAGPPIPNAISSSKYTTTENADQSQEFVPLDPEKFRTAVQQGGLVQRTLNVVHFHSPQSLTTVL